MGLETLPPIPTLIRTSNMSFNGIIRCARYSSGEYTDNTGFICLPIKKMLKHSAIFDAAGIASDHIG